MAYIATKSTEGRPNFLASEVGLVLQTGQVDDTSITPDEYGYKTVKGGTIYPANDSSAVGIVFEDTDVTHGEKAAGIIVAGRIIQSKLHTAPSADAITALTKSGIIFVDAAETIREEIDDEAADSTVEDSTNDTDSTVEDTTNDTTEG